MSPRRGGRATPADAEAPRPGADAGPEAELLSRARAGDERAFADIVRHHERLVRAVALGFTRDGVVAEEIAQDVFVRLFFALGRIRDAAALRAWLYRTTVNLCRDYGRRLARGRRTVPLEAASAVAASDGSAPGEDGRVRSALAQLPQEYAEPLMLRYFGDLRYAEIAAALGVPLGTVCSRLSRGLDELGRLLAAAPEPPA